MTDDQVWEEVVAWLSGILGAAVIRGWQGEQAPPRPYVMANLLNTSEVRTHELDREFTRLPDGGEIRPVIETEWMYSLHAYGNSPTDILRPLRAHSKINYINNLGTAKLVVHDLSIIRNIPEFQNERWVPRAQVDMNVRGLVKDGILLDNIEQYSIAWTRN